MAKPRWAGLSREWQADGGTGGEPAAQGAGNAIGTGERSLTKSDGMLCSRNDLKYSCITQQKKSSSISLQWQVLGVNRRGYDHYRATVTNNPVDSVHQEMLEQVKIIAEHFRSRDGARRMKKTLPVLGYPVTRDKARKLMRTAEVQVRHR